MAGTHQENQRIASQIAGCYNIQKSEVITTVEKTAEELRVEEIIKSDIQDLIEKGEISDQLGRGYGLGSEAMKFNKKGSEIKTQIPGMLSILEGEKTKLLVQLEILQEKIGSEPTQEYNTTLAPNCPKQYISDLCYPKYDEQIKAYPEPSDENKLCSKFNSICYMIRSICEDISTLSVLQKNLEDNKSYSFSISQLIALGFN